MKNNFIHRLSILGMLTFLISNITLAQTPYGLFQGDWKQNATPQPISTMAFENDSSLWIGSQNGGLYHLKDDTVLLYQSQNSNLPNNNIQHLKYDQGKLWMVTDSGLTSYQNQTFTHHGWQNLSQIGTINAIDCDSQGKLWLGGVNGVASFDGSSFSVDNSVSAHSLAVSAGDTVFIAPFMMFVNGMADDIQYFDGTQWVANIDFTPADAFIQPKLYSTSTGKVYISPKVGLYAGVFYQVNTGGFSPGILPSGYTSQDVSQISSIRANPHGLYAMYIKSGQTLGGIGYWKDNQSSFISERLPSLDMEFLDISENRIAFAKGNTFVVTDLPKNPRKNFAALDINNVKAGVNSNGKLFTAPHDRYMPKFETPSGDSTHTIFSSNLWVSAKDADDSLFVAAEMFQGHDFYSGTINDNFANYRNPIVKIRQTEIDDHKANYQQAGYTLPNNIKYWPANGDSTLGEGKDLAPFIDVNSNGYYDPENGDYPWIKGDQAIYFICNDKALSHSSSSGQAIGLEVHGMVYGWNQPSDTALHHTVFVDYTLINRSGQDLDSVLLGEFVEFDLGNGSDDYIGCDSALNMMYVYNGDSIDETNGAQKGYGQNPPSMGMRFLSDSLESFLYFSNGNSPTGEPQSPHEFHLLLQSRWRDGSHLVQGGSGHINSGNTTPTNYMFSGDPIQNTGWTEQSSGNMAGDRRGIATIESFSLANEQRKTISIAFGYGRKPNNSGNYLNNITTTKENISRSKSFIDTVSFSQPVLSTAWNPIPPSMIDDSTIVIKSVSEIRRINELVVFPNPASSSVFIKSEEPLKSLRLFDIRGVEIIQFPLSFSNEGNLSLPSNIPDGMYLLLWETKTSKTGGTPLMITK